MSDSTARLQVHELLFLIPVTLLTRSKPTTTRPKDCNFCQTFPCWFFCRTKSHQIYNNWFCSEHGSTNQHFLLVVPLQLKSQILVILNWRIKEVEKYWNIDCGALIWQILCILQAVTIKLNQKIVLTTVHWTGISYVSIIHHYPCRDSGSAITLRHTSQINH